MSRKTITILKCDLCGAEFQNTWNLFPVHLPIKAVDGNIYNGCFDLCESCMRDMQNSIMENFVKITRDENDKTHIERILVTNDDEV